MSDYGILDHKTKQITLTDDIPLWSEQFRPENRDLRTVKRDDLRDDHKISTVFLALDHGFGGRPQWFETMIFDKDRNDIFCRRYETWAEAWNGHVDAAYRFNEGTLLDEEK